MKTENRADHLGPRKLQTAAEPRSPRVPFVTVQHTLPRTRRIRDRSCNSTKPLRCQHEKKRRRNARTRDSRTAGRSVFDDLLDDPTGVSIHRSEIFFADTHYRYGPLGAKPL